VTGATDISHEVVVAVGVMVGVRVFVGVDVKVFVAVAVFVGVAETVGVAVAAASQVTEALLSAGSTSMARLSTKTDPPWLSAALDIKLSAVVPEAWHCICSLMSGPV